MHLTEKIRKNAVTVSFPLHYVDLEQNRPLADVAKEMFSQYSDGIKFPVFSSNLLGHKMELVQQLRNVKQS